MAPQKRTLIYLAMKYREKAKQEQSNRLLKDFYWRMAFEYLANYRHYYGGSL